MYSAIPAEWLKEDKDMFCPKCGTNVPEGSKFCETCGNNMQTAAEQTEIQEQPVKPQEPAPVAPPPVQRPQPQSQPVYQTQPQSPVYPLKPPSQPAPQPQPQYQQRPQPAPAPINNTYNGDDPREKPYSVGGWLLTMLIMCVPLVNIVMIFVWAFGSKTNKSKKNYFIAALIMAAIGIILSIVFAATISATINELLQQMNGFGDYNFDF
jgi:hypothetical protein